MKDILFCVFNAQNIVNILLYVFDTHIILILYDIYYI